MILRPGLREIGAGQLAQVAAGYPVMARIGGGLLSDAHYVVVVGFNQQKSTVLLRSGMDRRLLMSFSDFESKWNSAGHWAILTQRPSQLPANVDAQRWRDGESQRGHSCGEHNVCGNALVQGGSYVCFGKARFAWRDGKEENVVEAFHVEEGRKTCKVGYLAKHLAFRADQYDGLCAHITEVYSAN